jgi:hypothetical protein
MLMDIGFVLDQLVTHCLLGIGRHIAELRQPIDDVGGQMKGKRCC